MSGRANIWPATGNLANLIMHRYGRDVLRHRSGRRRRRQALRFQPGHRTLAGDVPMIHLLTLGAGGGSIAATTGSRHRQAGPGSSAGSDPGPACYDRGGLKPTVTDADLALGYLSTRTIRRRHIKLNPKRARLPSKRNLCDPIDMDVVEARHVSRTPSTRSMANGICQELRARGYDAGSSPCSPTAATARCTRAVSPTIARDLSHPRAAVCVGVLRVSAPAT